MTELVIRAEPPPDHQILVPRLIAEVHTVVLEQHRGYGIGSALVKAAEEYAAGRGVAVLIAPILASNTDAVSFYSTAGFGPHGVILSKELTERRCPSTMTHSHLSSRTFVSINTLATIRNRKLSRGQSVALPKVAILAEGLEVTRVGGTALADWNDVIDVQDGT